MRRVALWLIPPLVGLSALIWLAWGRRTYAEVVLECEKAMGKRGEWKVNRNEDYDSWFEGDRGGFLWIVTYDLPPAVSNSDFRLELWIKNLTGEVSGAG